jgi:alpha-glucosidase (family GH31 glycosyl hydrolase)
VKLPGAEPWYDAVNGSWVEGELSVKSDRSATPLFVRAGAIVPMQAGTPVDNAKDLLNVHFHIFVPPAWSGESIETYSADDGVSFAYRDGARSTAEIRLASAEGNLAISFVQKASGFGAIEPTFIIHGSPKSVRLNGGEVKQTNSKVVLTGKPLKVSVVE